MPLSTWRDNFWTIPLFPLKLKISKKNVLNKNVEKARSMFSNKMSCKLEIEIWSLYTSNLADCFLKAHSFKDISFEHCGREPNQVAHQLAKFSFASNFVVSWVDAPPSFCTGWCNYVGFWIKCAVWFSLKKPKITLWKNENV
jgi:hypothetical protein